MKTRRTLKENAVSENTITGIKLAVIAAGSQTKIARELGVYPQAVQGWVTKGYVPLLRAQQIHRLYGIAVPLLVSPKIREILLNHKDVFTSTDNKV